MAPRVVRLLIVQQFFEGFVPIMALYAVMFQRVGGLSLGQIGLLFSVWSLAYVAAELPSGILADFWSRRNVMIIGGILRAIGFLVWMFWPGFVGYAVGFALWGMMIACTSGALPAYLHSELRAEKKEKQFARYFGWLMSAARVVAVLLLTRLESIVRISLTKQVLAMCTGIIFLLVGLFLGKPIASLLILAFSLVFQLFRPVFMHHVQEVAHSEARATIGSIPGLAAGLFGAISYVVIGKL